MNANSSIYRRLFLYLLLSLLVAPVTMVFVAIIIRYAFYEVPLPKTVNYWIGNMYMTYSFWPLFLAGVLVLTLIYFSVFLLRMAIYFNRISSSLGLLAEGQFDVEIPVKKTGGLGPLAQNINNMKDQMKISIEEEKKAVQSKNELVTNVSHDLRTPLTSMIGYLRLIEEDQYRDEVELRHFVHIAYEKSIRLHHMVNDLFEYTKINNQDMVLKKTDFDVVELLHQLSTQFLPEIRNAGMELAITGDADRAYVNADPEKLMRVFENLISNAIKYGRNGKKIDLVVEKGENAVNIDVINYGEPIPSNALPFIFDRLYRTEQSRSTETGGAGLGLAIAKGIVELHHGEISADSNEEKTIFKVSLPIS